MSKVVPFPRLTPSKFGYRKARVRRGRKKINLEDFGQLNLFEHQEARVINLLAKRSVYEEALRFDDQGDTKRAQEAYLKAIAGNDHPDDACCNLGILYSQQQETTKAIDAFTQCLKNNPRHFEAHYNLANLFADLGNLRLAITHYEVSISINPEFSNGYYNLGLALATNKAYNQAIEAFMKYKDTAPMHEKENALELIRNIHRLIDS